MNSTLFILATFLLATNAYVHQLDVPNAPKGNLVNFLEGLKSKLQTGDEKLGLPVLDPFSSIQEKIDFKKDGLAEITALLMNVNAKGLSNFIVTEGEFKIIGMKLNVDLSWPEITATTGYIAKGRLANTVDVFGNGQISATVKDLSFATNLSLSMKDKKLYIRTIDSKVHLGSLDLKITGLYDDEDVSALLSTAISDMMPQLLDDYQGEVSKMINGMITEIGNDFLSTKTLKDLLDMIKG